MTEQFGFIRMEPQENSGNIGPEELISFVENRPEFADRLSNIQKYLDNQFYVSEVLRIFQEFDEYDDIVWRVSHDGIIGLSIMCSDFFYVACADAEYIDPVDLSLLRKCFEDCRECGYIDEGYGAILYAARKRKMAPFEFYLKRLDCSESLNTLFRDAPNYEFPA